jgi:transcription elongation factor GreB
MEEDMSRAFVRETDFDAAGAELPERPQSPYPNYVTPHGLKELQERCENLKAQYAALSGSIDDPMKQHEVRELERDLRYYLERLERAIRVDPDSQPYDEVHFGARVEVEDEAGETQQFTIVGEDEANVSSNKVSWVSPLARALMGARVGDSVTWKRPAGNKVLTLTSIAKAHDSPASSKQ